LEFVTEEVFGSSSPKTGSKEQINKPSQLSCVLQWERLNVSKVSVMLKCSVLLSRMWRQFGDTLSQNCMTNIQHCLLVVQTYLHDPLNCLMKLSTDVPRQLLEQLSDQPEQNSKITKGRKSCYIAFTMFVNSVWLPEV